MKKENLDDKIKDERYDSKNILSSSIHKLELDTGLDAKFMHRKKREGD